MHAINTLCVCNISFFFSDHLISALQKQCKADVNKKHFLCITSCDEHDAIRVTPIIYFDVVLAHKIQLVSLKFKLTIIITISKLR